MVDRPAGQAVEAEGGPDEGVETGQAGQDPEIFT
jgi:hypothetical protein